MYVLIDKDAMQVRYKHADAKVLADLMHIEFPQCAAAVLSCEVTMPWQKFSDLELRLLYKNLTGTNFPGFTRHGLEPNISTLLTDLPESTLNAAEIATQAAFVSATDLNYYRYAPGQTKPLEVNDAYAAKPLVSAAPYVPVIPPLPAANAAPTPVARVANPIVNALATQAKQAPTPRAPRDPNAAPVAAGAPAAGSKTGRVWEIAEQVWLAAGSPSELKDVRKQIIAACEAEGINGSTASVQFGKWKSTK